MAEQQSTDIPASAAGSPSGTEPEFFLPLDGSNPRLLPIPKISESSRRELVALLAEVEDHYFATSLSDLSEEGFEALTAAWLVSLRKLTEILNCVPLNQVIETYCVEFPIRYKKFVAKDMERSYGKKGVDFYRALTLRHMAELIVELIEEALMVYPVFYSTRLRWNRLPVEDH